MGNIPLFKSKEYWRGDIRNKKFHEMRLKMHLAESDEYRKGYPNKADDPNLNDNLLFYTNKIPCRPEGDYIDNILTNWFGDYDKLEDHHGYIQWLFPIRERGFNLEAQVLQPHEAQAIMNDPEAKERFQKAYFMMLDFYGMKIVSMKQGILDRAENFKERWANLKSATHNFLRITRILKSMGELGLEHYKYGMVDFMFEEVMINRTLLEGIESLYDYWFETLKDPRHRYTFRTRFTLLVKNYPEIYDRREKAVKARELKEKEKEELKKQQEEEQKKQESDEQTSEKC
nr:opioid growth factor receptor-like protein 1-like protein [Scolopendra mutilans]